MFDKYNYKTFDINETYCAENAHQLKQIRALFFYKNNGYFIYVLFCMILTQSKVEIAIWK